MLLVVYAVMMPRHHRHHSAIHNDVWEPFNYSAEKNFAAYHTTLHISLSLSLSLSLSHSHIQIYLFELMNNLKQMNLSSSKSLYLTHAIIQTKCNKDLLTFFLLLCYTHMQRVFVLMVGSLTTAIPLL